MYTYNPVPKPSFGKVDKPQKINHKRGGISQKRRGAISPSLRREVHARSYGVCEIRQLCKGSKAVHIAHLQSRNTIEETTLEMVRHACLDCHSWLDTNSEGIKYKRALRGA